MDRTPGLLFQPRTCVPPVVSIAFSWGLALLTVAYAAAGVWGSELLMPGFSSSEPFDEQVRWTRLENGIRILVNAPATMTDNPRRVIVFATPNGNSIEQTLGCQADAGIDWHFQIQQVAAQIRALRDIDRSHEWILAVVQAPKLSWPLFRKDNPTAAAAIHKIVQSLKTDCAAAEIVLTCHSGGGAFLWEYIAHVDAIPAEVSRIVFLDANYSYSDDAGHGNRLLAWLRASAVHRLFVVAYDDREIEMDGKKVVGADGGTWRASERMLARFRPELTLQENDIGPLRRVSGLNGQVQFLMHRNPQNKILHTALVGDMNGLLHTLTLGTPVENQWGQFGGPPAYTKWIQKQAFVERSVDQPFLASDVVHQSLRTPDRNPAALTGGPFRDRIRELSPVDREQAIVAELLAGNLPNRLRSLVPVCVQARDAAGTRHIGIVSVMSDYLAVGTDQDSFRVPLTPHSAVQIADAFEGSLITAKISDDVFAVATGKPEPSPLTKDRETVDTFFEHHTIIERQLVGVTDRTLIAGIKKDVVYSNALTVKPHRVAIFGWHLADGRPIQNLYAGHVDWYVDYSHGIRLMSSIVVVDGRPMSVTDVLRSPDLCILLSNEGVLDLAELRKASQW